MTTTNFGQEFTGSLIRLVLSTDADTEICSYGDQERAMLAIGVKERVYLSVGDWKAINTFCQRHYGRFIFGYTGFEMHRSEEDRLVSADYPTAYLVVPDLVVQIEGNKCTIVADGSHRFTRVIEEGSIAARYTEPRIGDVTSPLPYDSVEPSEFVRAAEEVLLAVKQAPNCKITVGRRVEIPTKVDLVESMVKSPLPSQLNRYYYFRTPHVEFAGCSPELLAIGDRSSFKTHKLSGTFRRGSAPKSTDAILSRTKLGRKILAEHELSVEEVRLRLAALGPVKRLGTRTLELTNLCHLLTNFETIIERDFNLAELLKTCLPSGVSQYPKDLSIIAGVEKSGRGAYYGLAGFVDPSGNYCFSQILRTIFKQRDEFFTWVGAAITSQSCPVEEYEETRLKLESITLVKTDS